MLEQEKTKSVTLVRSFLWGYVRDQAFIPPLTLGWSEIDYLIYVCRVTHAFHIEHLKYN